MELKRKYYEVKKSPLGGIKPLFRTGVLTINKEEIKEIALSQTKKYGRY